MVGSWKVTELSVSRMVVGVTGATGIVYAVRLLEMLRDLHVESHLIITKAAEQACAYETDLSARELRGSRGPSIRPIRCRRSNI
jgi:4-hydroxy-3-polyprenylbenzoate decarboxylase